MTNDRQTLLHHKQKAPTMCESFPVWVTLLLRWRCESVKQEEQPCELYQVTLEPDSETMMWTLFTVLLFVSDVQTGGEFFILCVCVCFGVQCSKILFLIFQDEKRQTRKVSVTIKASINVCCFITDGLLLQYRLMS